MLKRLFNDVELLSIVSFTYNPDTFSFTLGKNAFRYQEINNIDGFETVFLFEYPLSAKLIKNDQETVC